VAVALPFALDGVSFVLCALILLTLKGSFRPAPAAPDETRPTVGNQLREGLAAVARVPLLRLTAVLTIVVSIGQWMTLSVIVLFALHKLHLTSAGFGVLMAITAVGGIVGGALAPRLIRRLGYGVVLIGAVAVSGLTLTIAS